MSEYKKENSLSSNDEKKVPKRWMTPLDLEEYAGWSRSWQAKARINKSIHLPYVKIGKFVMYDKNLIDAFIEEHTVVGG